VVVADICRYTQVNGRAFLCMALLLFGGTANAHERSESESHWTYDNGDLHGVITTRTREVTRLSVPGDSYATLPQIFAGHVQQSMTAAVDGTPCTSVRSASLLGSEPGFVRVDVRMHCMTGEVLTLRSLLFVEVAPSHHHFVYLETTDTPGAGTEAILTASEPATQLSLRATRPEGTHVARFIAMGIEHIATGIDHLAFLLALLISVRTAREAVAIITGFTVGHSLTLSLALLGLIHANRGAVECLIGLTVALAAALNLIRSNRERTIAGLVAGAVVAAALLIPAEWRQQLPTTLIAAIAVTAACVLWLAPTQSAQTARSIAPKFTLALTFGWIHGLGFAGALQGLQLPRSQLVTTLFGFNVGVEVGQLLLVLAGAGLIKLVATAAPAARPHSEAAATLVSAALIAAGLSWFLTRAAA
jgi:hypothetical protein